MGTLYVAKTPTGEFVMNWHNGKLSGWHKGTIVSSAVHLGIGFNCKGNSERLRTTTLFRLGNGAFAGSDPRGYQVRVQVTTAYTLHDGGIWTKGGVMEEPFFTAPRLIVHRVMCCRAE